MINVLNSNQTPSRVANHSVNSVNSVNQNPVPTHPPLGQVLGDEAALDFLSPITRDMSVELRRTAAYDYWSRRASSAASTPISIECMQTQMRFEADGDGVGFWDSPLCTAASPVASQTETDTYPAVVVVGRKPGIVTTPTPQVDPNISVPCGPAVADSPGDVVPNFRVVTQRVDEGEIAILTPTDRPVAFAGAYYPTFLSCTCLCTVIYPGSIPVMLASGKFVSVDFVGLSPAFMPADKESIHMVPHDGLCEFVVGGRSKLTLGLVPDPLNADMIAHCMSKGRVTGTQHSMAVWSSRSRSWKPFSIAPRSKPAGLFSSPKRSSGIATLTTMPVKHWPDRAEALLRNLTLSDLPAPLCDSKVCRTDLAALCALCEAKNSWFGARKLEGQVRLDWLGTCASTSHIAAPVVRALRFCFNRPLSNEGWAALLLVIAGVETNPGPIGAAGNLVQSPPAIVGGGSRGSDSVAVVGTSLPYAYQEFWLVISSPTDAHVVLRRQDPGIPPGRWNFHGNYVGQWALWWAPEGSAPDNDLMADPGSGGPWTVKFKDIAAEYVTTGTNYVDIVLDSAVAHTTGYYYLSTAGIVNPLATGTPVTICKRLVPAMSATLINPSIPLTVQVAGVLPGNGPLPVSVDGASVCLEVNGPSPSSSRRDQVWPVLTELGQQFYPMLKAYLMEALEDYFRNPDNSVQTRPDQTEPVWVTENPPLSPAFQARRRVEAASHNREMHSLNGNTIQTEFLDVLLDGNPYASLPIEDLPDCDAFEFPVSTHVKPKPRKPATASSAPVGVMGAPKPDLLPADKPQNAAAAYARVKATYLESPVPELCEKIGRRAISGLGYRNRTFGAEVAARLPTPGVFFSVERTVAQAVGYSSILSGGWNDRARTDLWEWASSWLLSSWRECADFLSRQTVLPGWMAPLIELDNKTLVMRSAKQANKLIHSLNGNIDANVFYNLPSCTEILSGQARRGENPTASALEVANFRRPTAGRSLPYLRQLMVLHTNQTALADVHRQSMFTWETDAVLGMAGDLEYALATLISHFEGGVPNEELTGSAALERLRGDFKAGVSMVSGPNANLNGMSQGDILALMATTPHKPGGGAFALRCLQIRHWAEYPSVDISAYQRSAAVSGSDCFLNGYSSRGALANYTSRTSRIFTQALPAIVLTCPVRAANNVPSFCVCSSILTVPAGYTPVYVTRQMVESLGSDAACAATLLLFAPAPLFFYDWATVNGNADRHVFSSPFSRLAMAGIDRIALVWPRSSGEKPANAPGVSGYLNLPRVSNDAFVPVVATLITPGQALVTYPMTNTVARLLLANPAGFASHVCSLASSVVGEGWEKSLAYVVQAAAQICPWVTPTRSSLSRRYTTAAGEVYTAAELAALPRTDLPPARGVFHVCEPQAWNQIMLTRFDLPLWNWPNDVLATEAAYCLGAYAWAASFDTLREAIGIAVDEIADFSALGELTSSEGWVSQFPALWSGFNFFIAGSGYPQVATRHWAANMIGLDVPVSSVLRVVHPLVGWLFLSGWSTALNPGLADKDDAGKIVMPRVPLSCAEVRDHALLPAQALTLDACSYGVPFDNPPRQWDWRMLSILNFTDPLNATGPFVVRNVTMIGSDALLPARYVNPAFGRYAWAPSSRARRVCYPGAQLTPQAVSNEFLVRRHETRLVRGPESLTSMSMFNQTARTFRWLPKPAAKAAEEPSGPKSDA